MGPVYHTVRIVMKIRKYILTLLGALIVTIVFAWVGFIRGIHINYYIFTLSFIFAIAYVPLVVIKLPVFNKYYVKTTSEINPVHHNSANYKSAWVAVGFVTSATLSLIYYALKVPEIGYHSLLGGVAATVVSLYYEPDF